MQKARVTMMKSEARLLASLKVAGLKLAVAESCTGGLLAARLTAVPGASEVFVGGVVAYANEIKEKILGLNAARLYDIDVAAKRAELSQAPIRFAAE